MLWLYSVVLCLLDILFTDDVLKHLHSAASDLHDFKLWLFTTEIQDFTFRCRRLGVY